jgi:hypothetical protein
VEGSCSRRVMKYKPNAKGGRKHTRVWLMSSTAAGKHKNTATMCPFVLIFVVETMVMFDNECGNEYV